MRLLWTTDLHLNHCPRDAWDRWVAEVVAEPSAGLLITGDISEGDDVAMQLNRIAAAVPGRVRFVLGNHDFYRSSVGATRQRVIHAARDNPRLTYLTDAAAIDLGDGVYLVGEDGWGDATEGNYEDSPIRLNDFPLIEDFRSADPSHWKHKLQQFGRESADRLQSKLDALPEGASEVLVLTHVPPFRQACWYLGQTTNDDWAPFFVCGAVGQVLRRTSQKRTACRFTVLCGHTHHAGVAEIHSNLVVHTGAADYGQPAVEGVITIADGRLTVERIRDR